MRRRSGAEKSRRQLRERIVSCRGGRGRGGRRHEGIAEGRTGSATDMRRD